MPKVQIAAVGPVMMKVAAEECDGVMLHALVTARIANTVEEVILPRLDILNELPGPGSVETATNPTADLRLVQRKL